MDADVSAFERMAQSNYVIEAPAFDSELARNALAAMAHRTPGIKKDPNGGLGNEGYRIMVEEVRSKVAAEVELTKGYRIEFFDRTAAKPAKEADRILGPGKLAKAAGALAKRDPLAYAVQRYDDKSKVCMVIGTDPRVDIPDLMRLTSAGAGVNMGGVDAKEIHQWFLWHEVGHCLVGASETKADTFAALMAIKNGNSPEMVKMMANFREISELAGMPDDHHFMSSTLWKIAEMRDQLEASPSFKAMSVQDVAGLAKQLSDRYEMKPGEVAHIRKVRQAANELVQQRAFFVPEEGGLKRVGIKQWLEANSERLPEFGRLLKVLETLKDGPQDLGRFRGDPAKLRNELDQLSKAGDPAARKMLAVLKGPMAEMKPLANFAEAVNLPKQPLFDQIVAFDARNEKIAFTDDANGYAIKDRESDAVMRMGNVEGGGERNFDYASAVTSRIMGPR